MEFFKLCKVDSKGRILIPMPIRRRLKIIEGNYISLAIEDNCIIIKILRDFNAGQ
jgi:AbrB family looped-hinge helix DNA binding protein